MCRRFDPGPRHRVSFLENSRKACAHADPAGLVNQCASGDREWQLMPSEIARRLAAHWGQPFPSSRRASEAAIAEFESRHGVRMPSDLRECLLELDGTGDRWPGDQDARGFSFWQLTEIRPVNGDVRVQDRLPTQDFDGYFVFADFLTGLWTYAIKLSDAGASDTVIAEVGGALPIRVAGSFGEFVDLYLANSALLYPSV